MFFPSGIELCNEYAQAIILKWPQVNYIITLLSQTPCKGNIRMIQKIIFLSKLL